MSLARAVQRPDRMNQPLKVGTSTRRKTGRVERKCGDPARLGARHELKAHLRERLASTPGRRAVRELVPPGSLQRWGTFTLVIAAVLTLGQVGSAALERWSGARVGARCVDHRDCGQGESCLQHLVVDRRYCTHGCASDGDCPTPMRCGDIATLPDANRGVGAAGAAAAGSACVQ